MVPEVALPATMLIVPTLRILVPRPNLRLAPPGLPPFPVVVCKLMVETVMLLLTPARSRAPAERVSLPTPPTFKVPLLLQTKTDKPERSKVAREVEPLVFELLRTVTLPFWISAPPPVIL